MKKIESKGRDRNTYHWVKEETAKETVVEKILTALQSKKTHKFRPKNITELANKVSDISREYTDETGKQLKVGKSTLLREKGVYRPKLEAFLAKVLGSDAISTPVGLASNVQLTIQVRDLQLKLLEAKRTLEVLSMRLEGSEGSVFDAVEPENIQALEDQRQTAQTEHDLCTAISQMWTYMEKDCSNPFAIRNGEVIDSLSKMVVVKQHSLLPYLDWLSKQSMDK